MRSSSGARPTSASSRASPEPGSAAAWLLAARPKTLAAALVPVLVGTAAAHGLGFAVRPALAALALVVALALQVAANLFNDALDFARGADSGRRLGPTRVVQSGLLDARSVLRAGHLALAAATILGLPLVARGGWPIALLGLAALACAYGYTGGPLPLAYHGLGEPFVFLFFGLVAVAGTAYLQAGRLEPAFLLAAVQVGLLATAILAVNNLRDIDGDAAAGKRTLAVRLGRTGARVETALLLTLPFPLGLGWLALDLALAAALPWLALPLALALARGVVRTVPGPLFNRFLAGAAALETAFGLLLALGLVLGGGR